MNLNLWKRDESQPIITEYIPIRPEYQIPRALDVCTEIGVAHIPEDYEWKLHLHSYDTDWMDVDETIKMDFPLIGAARSDIRIILRGQTPITFKPRTNISPCWISCKARDDIQQQLLYDISTPIFVMKGYQVIGQPRAAIFNFDGLFTVENTTLVMQGGVIGTIEISNKNN